MESRTENMCPQDEMQQKIIELAERMQALEDSISKKRREKPRKIPRTICDDESLRELKLEIEKCSAVIQNVSDGNLSLTSACAEFGIDYRMFRNMVSLCRKAQLSSGKYPTPINIDEPEFSTWDERLYSDILGLPLCSKELFEAMPQDAEETLRYALEMSMTPREQRVIKESYENGKALDTIGDELGVTRSRVQQIRAKALRKLRYRIGHALPHGLEAAQKAAEMWEKEKEKVILALSEQCKDLDEDYRKANSELLMRTGRIPLEEMDFSVRAYNVLKRSGVESLADILCIPTEENLLNRRNCGKETAKEIISRVHQSGYVMCWER